MEDMYYEYLLRRAYQTGRNSSNGADADIYRDMEHADREPGKNDFQQKFAVVRQHVEGALREGLKRIRYSAVLEDIRQLEAMQAKLDWKFYDKDALDIIIKDAGHILKKNGLEV